MSLPSCLPLLLVFAMGASAAPSELALWPAKPPGDTAMLPPESTSTKGDLVGGRTVAKLSNVSNPTLTLYPAPASDSITKHLAVVVFPGGGYNILATDIEGTEVASFLNAQGYAAVVVKYRVPRRPGRPISDAPLQDAQRAMGLVRHHAAEWNLDTNRIGILGFSAGGNLVAMLSTHFDGRTYPHQDQADDLSCRPDFAVLVYPAYLTQPDGSLNLAPELKITSQTPPTFLVQSADDPVHAENSLGFYHALMQAHVPAELHLYARGGHGYGLRNTGAPVNRWTSDLQTWLKGVLSQ